MSKHSSHKECCAPMSMYGGYGMAGYNVGGCGAGAGASIKWFYALLILIVIVLQFGKRKGCQKVGGYNDECSSGGEGLMSRVCGKDDQAIDNSVLFIIVVFLLILCAGCFGGGQCGSGYGYGGGFGY